MQNAKGLGMAAAHFERNQRPEGIVDINPLLAFVALLIMPYVLFFGLLMLMTGQVDLVLLYESVVQVSGGVYVKAWMIGSFILALLGTVLMSGYRTRNYLVEQRRHSQNPARSARSLPAASHFTIEEDTHEEEASPETRYAELDSVLEEEPAPTPPK